MRYVRSYPCELPVLRDLLPTIRTPVQNSKLDVVDAGHFAWEDAADEHAALVTDWLRGGYAASGPRSAAP